MKTLNLVLLALLISNFAISMVGCVSDSSPDAEKSPTWIPFIGDYRGTLNIPDTAENSLAAQVIAYKDNTYRLNILTELDSRDALIAVLEGKLMDNTVKLSGSSSDGAKWQAKIEGTKLTGHYTVNDQSISFSLSHTVRLSPELGKKAPAGAIKLFDGQNLERWGHVPDATGYLNLSRIFGSIKGVIYLKADIWSDKTSMAILELGSNDALKAWLNNKQIVSHFVERGAAPAQEKVEVNLAEGWNKLLLKITNAGGGWGSFAKFVDSDGKPVTFIAEKDDNNPRSKSNSMLTANSYYLTQFDLAGPFGNETMETKKMHEMEFDPERSQQEKLKWQKFKFADVDYSPKWTLENGFMEVLPGSGSLISNRKFIDFQLHIEFRSPFMPDEVEQGRGNSGVYLQGYYEVQVLDSYGLEGADNECGGIYKTARPMVNMCAPPMQWQSYDITFRAPRFNDRKIKTKNARLSVIHNGTLIHDDIEIPQPTGGSLTSDISKPGGIMLQDHGDRVQYRNIWLVEN